MAEQLTIERCPETGICSIRRESGDKIDLMPDEVEEIRESNADPVRITAVLAESDRAFAVGMTPEELDIIWKKLS